MQEPNDWKLERRHARPTTNDSDTLSLLYNVKSSKSIKTQVGVTTKRELNLTHVYTHDSQLRISMCKTTVGNQWEISGNYMLLKRYDLLTWSNTRSLYDQLKIRRPMGHGYGVHGTWVRCVNPWALHKANSNLSLFRGVCRKVTNDKKK